MTEPQFTVPLSALVEVFPWAGSASEWWWACVLHGREEDAEHSGSAPSESAARAAAITHLAVVHGIRAAGGEIAEDRLRDANKVVAEHMKALAEPGSASATKWAESVGAGGDAARIAERAEDEWINSLGTPAEPGQCGEILHDMQLGRNVVCVLPAGHDLGWHASRQVGGAAITWGHAPDLRRTNL